MQNFKYHSPAKDISEGEISHCRYKMSSGGQKRGSWKVAMIDTAMQGEIMGIDGQLEIPEKQVLHWAAHMS